MGFGLVSKAIHSHLRVSSLHSSLQLWVWMRPGFITYFVQNNLSRELPKADLKTKLSSGRRNLVQGNQSAAPPTVVLFLVENIAF